MENVPWSNWKRDTGGSGRDPMVLADGGKFYMYFTADAKEGPETGVVAVWESDDLLHWSNPRIAVRGNIACESPHVWKSGDTYYMFTSAQGADTWSSKHPVTGWTRTPIPRAPVGEVEKYVRTSGGYAEELVRLDDGTLVLAALTFRRWGNSIYFFKVETDKDGRTVGYRSPFEF